MGTVEERIKTAEALWQRGAQAELIQDYVLAYQLYTQANDEIMDCARLHQYAHEKIRRVNLKLRNYTELLGDWVLHRLAPLGFFELIAYLAKTDGATSSLCKRNT